MWLLTSVTVNNNSPIQDYLHPDDQTQPTFDYLFYRKFFENNAKFHRKNGSAVSSCSESQSKNEVRWGKIPWLINDTTQSAREHL